MGYCDNPIAEISAHQGCISKNESDESVQDVYGTWFLQKVMQFPHLARKFYSHLDPHLIFLRPQYIEFWERFVTEVDKDPMQICLETGAFKANDVMSIALLLQPDLRVKDEQNIVHVMNHFISTILSLTHTRSLRSAGKTVKDLLEKGCTAEEAIQVIRKASQKCQFYDQKDDFSVSNIDLEKFSNGEGFIKTHIAHFDQQAGGIQRKKLTVIAARTSVGKTAFSFEAAVNVARQKMRVAYFTLEMDRDELWLRMVCAKAGVPVLKFQDNAASPTEKQKITDMHQFLSDQVEGYLLINDTAKTLTEVQEQVARLQTVDLVVIDHIGILRDVQAKPPYEKIGYLGYVTQTLKGIAKNFGCAVIAVSQLNRSSASREDKQPTLADIRDSGEIEQNSDVVICLHRDDYYDIGMGGGLSKDTQLLEINILKNRYGRCPIRVVVEYNLKKQEFSTPPMPEIPF